MWFQGVHVWANPGDIRFIHDLLPEELHEYFLYWTGQEVFRASVGDCSYRVELQGGSPSLTVLWAGGLSLEAVRAYEAGLNRKVNFGFYPVDANDVAVADQITRNVGIAESWDKDLPLSEVE